MTFTRNQTASRWTLFALLLLLRTFDLNGQQLTPSADSKREEDKGTELPEVRVLERGPHHKVEEYTSFSTNEDGRVLVSTNRYTAVETGMHWLDRGEWKPTRVELDEYLDGFAALEGSHKVLLRRSLRVQGAVELAPDERSRLRATPMQILYRDRATDKVVVLGEVQDSDAVRTGPSSILWPNAFRGIRADYRATYRTGNFECDVILREAPPSPSELGLDPSTTELQVMTEFFDSSVEARRFRSPEDLEETHLSVGSMEFGEGTAFGEDSVGGSRKKVAVRKDWIEVEGRRFLIESVPLTQAQRELELLPREGAWKSHPRTKNGIHIPDRMVASTGSASWQESVASLVRSGTHQTAALVDYNRLGYVVDYVVVSSVSNFTFSSTNTYYIAGPVTLSGTVAFEPMTVIKYAKTNNSELAIHAAANLIWNGEPYRPVFMTAKDDNSVGATLPGSSGSPAGTYANLALSLPGQSTAAGRSIRDLRIAYAKTAIRATYGNSKHLVRHAQFVKCDQGVSAKNAVVEFQNILMTEVKTNFANLESSTVRVYFATLDIGNKLNDFPDSSTINFYSVLCTAVADTSNVIFNGPGPLSSNTGIYNRSAAGGHYLATGSPYLTTSPAYGWLGSAPSEIVADSIAAPLTKIAPTVLSGSMSTKNTFIVDEHVVAGPTSEVDIQPSGYLYWKLNIVVSNLNISSGGALMVGGGVRGVGIVGDQPFKLQGGTIVIEGSPANRIVLSRVSAVQEDSTLPSLSGSSFTVLGGNPIAYASFRFVDVNLVPSEVFGRRQLCSSSTALDGSVQFKDCNIYGLNIEPYYMGYSSGFALNFVNNIFEFSRISIGQATSGYTPQFNFHFYNNLCRLGAMSANWSSASYGTWNIRDNVFESCSVTSSGSLPSSHNAFYQSTSLPGPGNVYPANMDWWVGSYGRFYVNGGSLNVLVNSGSRTAEAAGLSDFTLRYFNLAEKNDTISPNVDIGFHYVVNTWDSDTDGLSNSSEIALGFDPYDSDSDNDGGLDGVEYWNGTNPRVAGDYPPSIIEQFRMDNSTFSSELGTAPIANTCVLVDSFDGNACSFQGSNQKIVYPVNKTIAGKIKPVINFTNGSIRLTYVPNWYSGNQSDQPGSWLRLIECGGWRLSIDPQGSRVWFECPDQNATIYTNLSLELPKPAGPPGRIGWEIELSYSQLLGTCIVVNDSVSTNSGYVNAPSSSEIANGWAVGNSISGGNHCKGFIDNLETIGTAYLVSFEDYSTRRVFRAAERRSNLLSASVISSGIKLDWLRGWEGDWATNGGLYSISRRIAGGGAIFSTIASNVRTNSYIDTTATLGEYYEYRIGRHPGTLVHKIPSIISARNGRAIDRRGRVLILVDNVVSNSIASELEGYRKSLIAEGWVVSMIGVPRHKDRKYLVDDYSDYVNNAMPQNKVNRNVIKGAIANWYNLAPNDTNAAVLVGHVTIPHSGYRPQDNHFNHAGAWPADVWYADMNGQWSDDIAFSLPLNGDIYLSNSIGDGRFDQETIPLEGDGSPGKPELSIGRIDFRMMKNFVQFGEQITDTADPTEIRLLKQYFQKVYQYRSGLMPAQDNIVAFIKDIRFMHLASTVTRYAARAGFGELTAPNRFREDLFLTGSPTLVGIHGHYGNYNAFGYNQGDEQHLISQIANGAQGHVPRCLFSLYCGSYHGEWFNVNSTYIGQDVLRAVIAVPNHSLTSTWMDSVSFSSSGFDWRIDRFLMGSHYGTALQDSFAVYPDASCRHVAILGDPMLRAAPMQMVENFIANKWGPKSLGYDVKLSWTANSSATAGYRILRAATLDSPSWEFLAEVTGTNWIHTASNPSTNMYLIKPLAIKVTGSGVFTNLGMGSLSSPIVIP